MLNNNPMNGFHALSDENRRKILELLAQEGRLSASAIGQHFQISPPAISQHLKVLREAHLVLVEPVAQKRFYSLDLSGLSEIERWALAMKHQWNQRLDRLESYINQLNSQENHDPA